MFGETRIETILDVIHWILFTILSSRFISSIAFDAGRRKSKYHWETLDSSQGLQGTGVGEELPEEAPGQLGGGVEPLAGLASE